MSSSNLNIETSADTYVGRFPLNGRFLNGQVDELRVWNVARSASDLQSTLNSCLTGNESGLEAYYNFNETSGTVLNDVTSNANNGTLTNMDGSTDWVISGITVSSSNPSTTFTWNNNIANDVDIKKEKNRGVVTKAALAKKVLKKGIKANLVTKFDEDGDAIESVYSQKISQEGKDYDENFDTTNETQSSGINLTEAARVLKAEDRYDQQIEREKVSILN